MTDFKIIVSGLRRIEYQDLWPVFTIQYFTGLSLCFSSKRSILVSCPPEKSFQTISGRQTATINMSMNASHMQKIAKFGSVGNGTCSIGCNKRRVVFATIHENGFLVKSNQGSAGYRCVPVVALKIQRKASLQVPLISQRSIRASRLRFWLLLQSALCECGRVRRPTGADQFYLMQNISRAQNSNYPNQNPKAIQNRICGVTL